MNSKKIQTSRKGETRMTKNAGFTLIELMIAMVIFGLVIAGVVGAFWEQLRSHNTQQQILAMQQNARAAMYFMTTELRMAGFDPIGTSGAGLTIIPDDGVTTDVDEFRDIITFSMDLDGNGDTAAANEQITYSLVDNQIIRTDGAGTDQILADNIEVIDFVYWGADPADLDDPIDTIRLLEGVADTNPGNVRSVNIAIIARIDAVLVASHKVRDNTAYTNIDTDIILPQVDDNFRRINLRKTVKLRNMGLE